jgi:flagellar hook-associated protein 1
MSGLFGTLNLATRSLATQQQGAEVAGHNLANVNNPAYARQRLAITTSNAVPGPAGLQGSGVQAVAIHQLRNTLLDRQIQTERSVRGSLDAQQRALQNAQANLGQEIDRHGSQLGLAEDLADLFNAFHSLSSQTTSMAERQVLVLKAQALTTQFSQIALRFDNVNHALNDSVHSDVNAANSALADIARLNARIIAAEIGGADQANDLRDIRQERIETLAQLVHITTISQSNGAIDVSLDGLQLVQGPNQLDQLESFPLPSGNVAIRSRATAEPLTLTGGSLHGTIHARDGAIASLRDNLDVLAAQLIDQVNLIHSQGFSLQDQTGLPFFTGSNAASIRVHEALLADPSRIQAAANPDAPGDNQVILALAALGTQAIPGLQNQTFSQQYHQSVASLGQSLNQLNSQVQNQNLVEQMLLRQRDSISGVSLDEEMTDLIRFQRAFEASARLITTISDMLETVVNLKR